MGSCQSQENQELAARNKAIEKQINQDKRAGSSIVKLLLLGKPSGATAVKCYSSITAPLCTTKNQGETEAASNRVSVHRSQC